MNVKDSLSGQSKKDIPALRKVGRVRKDQCPKCRQFIGIDGLCHNVDCDYDSGTDDTGICGTCGHIVSGIMGGGKTYHFNPDQEIKTPLPGIEPGTYRTKCYVEGCTCEEPSYSEADEDGD